MHLQKLTTERRNRSTQNLDTMSSLDLVIAMNREDAEVPRAIKRALPQIANAVDLVTECLRNGGRLIYVGTGTSGRIGALDASECAPTFGIPADRVQFVMAGGESALVHPSEDSEDSVELGRRDMAARKPGKKDVVVGLAASGRTPYTISALEYAAKRGAKTIAVACNHGSELGKAADVSVEVDVGPEVLAGSSRLKAGTAEKLICNMLSTGAMAQLGYVYSNLMVNMRVKNEKLFERGIVILQSLSGVDRATAVQALQKAGMSLPIALVMLEAEVGKSEATRRLRSTRGNVRRAIEEEDGEA